ncbi:MAG: ribonuclease P protein component [Proteobacteria bacterium]|nr:ribonuclease P protein component [Pseudomonadota bacterium]
MGNFRLRKRERVTKKTEFQIIFKNGARYITRNFIVIIYQNNQGLQRLGVSVSKKVGGAVKRNRVKRLLREFFRLNKGQLPEASDILFIAKPGSSQINYSTLSEEMLGFFQRLPVD